MAAKSVRKMTRATKMDGAGAVAVAVTAMPRILEDALFENGRGGTTPSHAQLIEAAKVVHAQKELVRVAELRLIHQAARAKTSQEGIAALLGTSQPTISRIIKQITENPSVLVPSPSEVINQRAVGQVDDQTMMDRLLAYSYGEGGYDPTGGDGFVRGDWRQIENALIAGLITDEEYECIARESSTEKPTRVGRR